IALLGIIVGQHCAGNSRGCGRETARRSIRAVFPTFEFMAGVGMIRPEIFGRSMMSVHEHKEKGKKSIRCYVITVSDTRDESTDTSGQTIKKFLADEAHEATGYRIVKDEPVEIEKLLNEALGQSDVDAVIVNGGTGIAPRDGTYEVVSRFLEKKLDGFGEIFRY